MLIVTKDFRSRTHVAHPGTPPPATHRGEDAGHGLRRPETGRGTRNTDGSKRKDKRTVSRGTVLVSEGCRARIG